MRRILLCLVLAGVAAALPARAEDVSLQASLDRNVAAVGEQVTYQLTLRGAQGSPNPRLPAMPNFVVQPMGTARSVSFVNGAFSSSSTYSYALVPRAAGRYTIASAEVDLNGKTFHSNGLELEVRTSAAPRSAPSTPPVGAPRLRRGGKALFVRASVDHDRAFVNQQLTWTFKFYQAVRTSGNLEYTGPPVSGFWSEELPPQRNYYETVDGVEYYVTELRMALFPTTPGKHQIGSANLRCMVQEVPEVDPDDPFRMLSGGMGQLRKVSLSSDPIPIEALQPPGAPSEFRGAVGSFTLESSVDHQEVGQNEPVTLTVHIRGTGNVKTVPDPVIPSLSNFKQYPGESSVNLSKTEREVKGERIFQTVLIPQVVGEYRVPALSMTFFDPGTRQFHTVHTEPIPIRVRAGAGVAAQPTATAAAPTGPVDVRYIRTGQAQWSVPDAGILRRPRTWLLDAIPFLGFLAGIFLLDRRKLRALHSPGPRGAGRTRQALLKLRAAETSAEDFLARLQQSIAQYLSEGLRVPPGLAREEMLAQLRARGFSDDVLGRLSAHLETQDHLRFAPGIPQLAERHALVDEALRVVESLEKEKRGARR